jgi:hypothetical protein
VYGFIGGREGCRGMRALAIGVWLKVDGWERGFEFMRSAGSEEAWVSVRVRRGDIFKCHVLRWTL